MVDTLPAGLTFRSSSVGCTGSADGTVVTCPLPAVMRLGDLVTRSFVVDIAPDLDHGSLLTNTVVVDSDTPDPEPDNNSASTESPVMVAADVTVAGTLSLTVPPPAAYAGAGSQRTQTFTVANLGLSVARDVQFRARLGVDAVILGLAEGAVDSTCVVTGAEITCRVDNSGSSHTSLGISDLWPGESVEVTVTYWLPPSIAEGTYPANLTDAAASGSHVRVWSPTSDPNLTNNVDAVPLVVAPPITELVTTKVALDTIPHPIDGDDTYVAGLGFRYEITVAIVTLPASLGYVWADAATVQLADVLPAGFVASSAAVSGGGACTVAPDGDRVSCALGTLPGAAGLGLVPQETTIVIEGTLSPSVPPSDGTDDEVRYPNTATVTSTTADPDGSPASSSATATVDVIQLADLTVEKVSDLPVLVAGEDAGWTLTVFNDGPSDATAAELTDVLPAGLVYDPTASDPACALVATVPAEDPSEPGTAWVDEGYSPPRPITQQVIRCVLDIPADGEVSVQIGAHLPATGRVGSAQTPYLGCLPEAGAGPGVPPLVCNSHVSNAASVEFPGDPDPDNNGTVPPTVTPVIRLANLTTSGEALPDSIAAGEETTYTVTWRTAGPSVAELPTYTLLLPPGFELVSFTNPPELTCVGDVLPGPPEQHRVVCEVTPDLTPDGQVSAPGDVVSITVVAKAPEDLEAGTYTARAMADTITEELDYDDNDVDLPVAVEIVADTRIVKTVVTQSIIPGSPVAFRLDVRNAGPSRAREVTITDVVPAGTTFLSAALEDGGDAQCVLDASQATRTLLTCVPGDLAVGSSFSILATFDLPIRAVGVVENTAAVSSLARDPDMTNNQSTATGPIGPPPPTDVGVTLTPPIQTASKDSVVTITATTTNHGPVVSHDTVLTLTLPADLTGVTVVLASQTPGGTAIPTCTIAALVATCDIGELAVGSEAVYTITGTVDVEGPNILTVEAKTAHFEADANPDNDTAEATVSVLAPPPLASPTPSPTPTPKQLAKTGMNPALPFLAGAGFALVLLGALLLASRRRRKEKERDRKRRR